MTEVKLKPETIRQLLQMQKEEITSYRTYSRLAKIVKDEHNSATINRIANEESRHYDIIKKYTNKDIKPDNMKVNFFFWLSKILGITFGIKLMEKGEEEAQEAYREIAKEVPEIEKMLKDEENHEKELMDMLDGRFEICRFCCVGSE